MKKIINVYGLTATGKTKFAKVFEIIQSANTDIWETYLVMEEEAILSTQELIDAADDAISMGMAGVLYVSEDPVQAGDDVWYITETHRKNIMSDFSSYIASLLNSI